MVVWYSVITLVCDYFENFISPVLKDNLPDTIIMVGIFLLSGLEIHNSMVFSFLLLSFHVLQLQGLMSLWYFLTSLLLILPIVFHLIYCASNPRHLLVFQHLNYFSSNVHCWVSYLNLDSFTSFIWLFYLLCSQSFIIFKNGLLNS